MMSFSRQLLQEDVWAISKDQERAALPNEVAVHYQRARSMCRNSGLTLNDILQLSPKFWDFHSDLIGTRDPTAFTIATIHVNLCIGTLGSFVKERPELSELVQKLLNFDICGEFLLTEVGHGLDARNLETTATLQPDGTFDLHTPHPAAAKAMPPTTPASRIPRVAIVFARLIVDEEARGVKPFIVWLSEFGQMKRGITSRQLPTRPGTKPLDHAITTFNHVRLSPNALLGSLDRPENERAAFLRQIWRVSIGTLSLSLMGIPFVRVGTHIAAVYSQRRKTGLAAESTRTPIMAFSTQYRSIVNGWVQAAVLRPYARWTVDAFMNTRLSYDVRHGLAAIFKATVVQAVGVLTELSERCGWQGIFSYNQISQLALSFQGNSIAEGDTLVLSIRLASELIGGRYQLPKPLDQSTPLAKREQQLMDEARDMLKELGGYQNRRSPEFNRHVLPRCRPIIEAIGHRMAFEAAKAAGVDHKVLQIYESLYVPDGSNIDSQRGDSNGMTSNFGRSVVEAYEDVLQDVIGSLESSEIADYVTAPIASEESWNAFVENLACFEFPAAGKGGFQPKL